MEDQNKRLVLHAGSGLEIMVSRFTLGADEAAKSHRYRAGDKFRETTQHDEFSITQRGQAGRQSERHCHAIGHADDGIRYHSRAHLEPPSLGRRGILGRGITPVRFVSFQVGVAADCRLHVAELLFR